MFIWQWLKKIQNKEEKEDLNDYVEFCKFIVPMTINAIEIDKKCSIVNAKDVLKQFWNCEVSIPVETRVVFETEEKTANTFDFGFIDSIGAKNDGNLFFGREKEEDNDLHNKIDFGVEVKNEIENVGSKCDHDNMETEGAIYVPQVDVKEEHEKL